MQNFLDKCSLCFICKEHTSNDNNLLNEHTSNHNFLKKMNCHHNIVTFYMLIRSKRNKYDYEHCIVIYVYQKCIFSVYMEKIL